MRRRILLAAGLAWSAMLSSASAKSAISVIYVGGWDCPFCTSWKNNYKAAWLSSSQYKKVTYVEVDSPNLKEAYEARYWRGDLASIREQIPHKSGTPRFLIVKDGLIVGNEFGESKWAKIVAKLDKLLA